MATNKVFGIGFHKTGTTSLAKALRILGYNTIHGDPSQSPPFGDSGITLIKQIESGNFQLPTLDKYEAFTDNPYFTIWKELYEKYPGGKYILTVRDERKWIKSCIRFFKDREVLPMRKWMFGEYGDPSSSQKARQAWLDRYRDHNQQIIDKFKDCPSNFLIMDISNGDGWNELCNFLEKPMPDVPFPYENVTRQSWLSRIRMHLSPCKKRLTKNILNI